MIAFDPLTLIFWIFVTSFIPGAVLSVAALKKTKLNLVEKILTGFGLGLVIPSAILTIFSIAGIDYSFTMAIVSVVLFYIAAIALFIKEKPYEEFSIKLELNRQNIISIFLILVVFLSFWIRFQTYSPVFHELDPYFYTYITYQTLTEGQAMNDDGTGWYPEASSNHRLVPGVTFLEASWYSFVTQGDENIDNYLVATVASIYPPVVAAFAVFFMYLFVSSQVKREYGVIAAALASLLPILMLKLLGGEMEIQPYAFFALAFFMAMYALAMRDRNRMLAVFAGIAFAALAFGSASMVVALSALLIFIPLQSLFLFFKEKAEDIKEFIVLNGIVFIIGSILGTLILRGLYTGSMSYATVFAFFAVIAFSGILYYIKEKIKDLETSSYVVGGLLLVSALLFVFTPIGDQIKAVAMSGLGIAEFKVPLHRTIAEQPVAGAVLDGQMGMIGKTMSDGIGNLILAPFTFISNLILSGFVSLINTVFGTSLSLVAKEPSILMLAILLFVVYLFYSFYRSVKNGVGIWLFFAAILLPGTIIGLMKLKYTIYAGFFVAAMIGILLGEADKLLQKFKDSFSPGLLKGLTYALIILGILLVFFQYQSNPIADPLLKNSMKPRFQENPGYFKEKFTLMCNEFSVRGISEQQLCSEYYSAFRIYPCSSYDTDICLIAEDPERYADLGTEEQFNSKLCYYSLIDDVFNPQAEEIIAASYRCQRITPYWLDSMEWIRYSTEDDSRTTSWWDYGHWINYFGLKNTVLRNEHASKEMIGEVAYAYVDGSIDDLKQIMKKYDSEYILIDGGPDGVVRTKFGALNYLSCARNNETSVNQSPGGSTCESEHFWETVYLPKDESQRTACTISEISGKEGIVMSSSKHAAGYCLGTATMVDGSTAYSTYYLDKKHPNGDLVLNKAYIPQVPSESGTWQIQFEQSFTATDQMGVKREVMGTTLYYTDDEIWIENGEIKSGYEDRKGKYYDSVLYKGYYLEELPGFELVYRSKGNEVKIYKLEE